MKKKVDAKRIIIVGAVAGGASCAARCRRLMDIGDSYADRGPYVSFANRGLPYYIGGVIAEEAVFWSQAKICSVADSISWFALAMR